jgi:glycosyltransferase involved in cell wall biosynthesis
LRVHQIINDYSLSTGGAQRIVRNLHEYLPKKGVVSRIFGISYHDDDDLENAQSLSLGSPYQFRAIKKIYDYLSENVKPGDIIHAHLFPAILYVSLLKMSGKLTNPIIFTEHSTSNRRRNNFLGSLIDRFTYTGCDKVVAISEATENKLTKWKPKLKTKIVVINNGSHLHFKQFNDRPIKKRVRIVSVGRLTDAKNYSLALEAVSELGAFDLEYWIAGDGQLLHSLTALSQKLGIENRVKFLGYVDNVSELLAQADIFLIPSLWEGFGLAAVEAMNAGLPIIASDIPGLREVVNSKVPCAELINPKSKKSVSNGLKKLITSHQLRKKLGINGFERAKVFSLDKMIDGYIKVYSEISDSEFN